MAKLTVQNLDEVEVAPGLHTALHDQDLEVELDSRGRVETITKRYGWPGCTLPDLQLTHFSAREHPALGWLFAALSIAIERECRDAIQDALDAELAAAVDAARERDAEFAREYAP